MKSPIRNPAHELGMQQKVKTIFPSWHIDHWRAVDDRVRGGSSVSHLDAVESENRDESAHAYVGGEKLEENNGKGKEKTSARFWGNLDTKTLGGAGFASQSYQYSANPLELPRLKYSGIQVAYRPDPKTTYSSHTPLKFTIVLKTRPTAEIPREPKAPRQSQLTYEVNFELPHPSASTTTTVPRLNTGDPKGHVANFGWSEFQATYRGRPVHKGDERWIPLDPAFIYEFSFMCRSDFGKQEGDFGVIIDSLDAVLNAGHGMKEREQEGWSLTAYVRGWINGVVSWFRNLLGWSRIKLDDEESAEDEKRALIG